MANVQRWLDVTDAGNTFVSIITRRSNAVQRGMDEFGAVLMQYNIN